jgi:O-antigen/teichoic acid export membrane protein
VAGSLTGEPPADSTAPGAGSISSGSTGWFIYQIVNNAALFAGVLIIARVLGPVGRGSVAFLTVSAQVVGYLAPIGVSEATLVFAARRIEARPRLIGNLLFAASVGALVGATILVGFLALVPSARPPRISTAELIALGLAILSAAAAQSSQLAMTGCGLFWPLARISVAIWLYPIALLAISTLSHLTVARATLAWAGALGVASVGCYATLISRFGITMPTWSLLRESIHFGSRAWIGSLARFLNFRVDQLVTAFLASTATLGIYAAAVNVSELLLYLPAAVGWVLVSFVAGGGVHAGPARTLHVLRVTLLLTTCSAAIAAAAGPSLLPLLYGSRFHASVTPFLLLLPGAFGFVFIAILSSVLMASAAPGRSSLGALVALPVGVALDFALIPTYGASGAAAAASIALGAGGMASLAAYRSRVEFSWNALVPGRDDVANIVVAVKRFVAPVRQKLH